MRGRDRVWCTEWSPNVCARPVRGTTGARPPVRALSPRIRPYNFTRFGAMAVIKPYKFVGFGTTDVIKPYKSIGVGCHQTVKIYR